MNKIILISALIVLLVILTCAFKIYSSSMKQRSMDKLFIKEGDYTKLWNKVDSLQNISLPKSALQVVDQIYKMAKAENNSPELIKAIIHKMKFSSMVEEESTQKLIGEMELEIKSATSPVKQLLQSMLAEGYWRYYTNNRYKFYNRTETVNFVQADISTWDGRKIVDEAILNYKASLEDQGKLKGILLKEYYTIIYHNDEMDEALRPTLYDFLAQRAVDFYMNDEPGLMKAAAEFQLNNSHYFDPAEEFVKINFEAEDSLNMKFLATSVLKDLLQFHLNDSDPSALIDVDLKRLKFVKNKMYAEGKDELYITALENLENKFLNSFASAQVSYERALYYEGKGNAYKPLVSAENQWMKKKAYEICEEAMKRAPKSLGAINCQSLKNRIEEKSISITVEEVNIPVKPFLGLVKYKNVSKVYFKVFKITPNEYREKLAFLNENNDQNKLIESLLSKTAVQSWPTQLPLEKDFQEHSAEIKIPSLAAGMYVVLCGTDPNLSFERNAVTYSFVNISSISYIHKNISGRNDFYLADRSSGLPLANVKVQLWKRSYNYGYSKYDFQKSLLYTSGTDGFLTIPNLKSDRDFAVEFFYKEEILFVPDALFDSYGYSGVTKPETKVFFFTDRAIYRPGQTIYYKGIALEVEGDKNQIKPAFSTTVSFYDVNYQLISEQKVVTNEYGTFHGSFTAPQGVLNGRMQLQNTFGNITVLVEEYKRPKFEVSFLPVKGSYKLGEFIDVSGLAKAYAGSNIDQAEVKYRVVRNVNYPHWWWYWRGYSPSSPMEITNGFTKTDEQGEFKINFKAIADPSVSTESQPSFSYTIYADVVDISGETHSSETTVTVGYSALLINTDLPDQIDNKKGVTVKINATNLNGETENSKGEITIYRLKSPDRIFRSRKWERPDQHLMSKEEFYKNFPYDQYDDEMSMPSWEKESTVFNNSYDTEKNKEFKLENIVRWKVGKYVMEIKTKDKFAVEVKDVKYFSVIDPVLRSVGPNIQDWVIPVKVNAEPGEKASVLLSVAEDVQVVYEIEHQANIVSRSIINLNKEQKLIEIPVEEKYRGGFAIHFAYIRNNEVHIADQTVSVPWTNKMLDIQFETFRNKLLPGQKEEWKITIKDKKGEKVAAEMLASMYDASLDAFANHNWIFDINPIYDSYLTWHSKGNFNIAKADFFQKDWNTYSREEYRTYPELNWFGFSFQSYQGRMYKSSPRSRMLADDDVETLDIANAVLAEPAKQESGNLTHEEKEIALANGDSAIVSSPIKKNGNVQIRKNLNETAFFYPDLKTNEKGELVISFTIPEALTKWKMMGLAHTKDLKYSLIEKELVTQKELMVLPNVPRFFRKGDQVYLSSKISNLSENDLYGTAELLLFDALTMQPIDPLFKNINGIKNFSAKKGQSAAVDWQLSIPEGIEAVTYRIVATAGNFSDGEEAVLPVLTNRMLVTESLPLPMRGNQTKNFTLGKLVNNNSSTLRNHKLTLEFTSNSAWYAIQALPYLMEYPYECAEQTFSRFYANSIASHVANSSPKIKAVFDSWKNSSDSKALLSNLEKNQELKSVLLEETPWVLDAKSETERKKRIALLFDLNKMSKELETALTKLQKMQSASGAWPWFQGMPEDRYITQHIVTGLGHLDHLGIKNIRSDSRAWKMLKEAVNYLDRKIAQDYDYLIKNKIKLENQNIGSTQIQYLYARSYFKDLKIDGKSLKAFEYYKGQSVKYWMHQDKYMQGMIALGLQRYDELKTPAAIVKSLREHALHSEEMGMYWKTESGYYWYQAPIETQALLVEVFDEVAKDKKAVDDMKIWLLKQKQTQNWPSTKSTTEACYALLLKGTNWLADSDLAEIKLGNQTIDPKKIDNVRVEAGTGYFKTSWSGSEIKPEMGNVTVSKKTEGIAWGALYWQYFEQLDKITPSETPIQLKKQLFLQRNSSTGPVMEPVTEATKLNPGDLLKVRIELRVDRNMEYVHMKDMRAGGFEPVNVLSVHKYHDGLSYYESTRDAATNFFFSYLSKGTYVFEYPLRVNQRGNFSNGITSIQCMYAPEFSSHSEGIRVNVGQENVPAQIFTDEGIIKKGIPVEVDGCGTMIEIGGVSYKVLNLPKEFIIDKLKVKVSYKPGEIFYCGRGRAPIKTVEILMVEKR